MGDRAPEAGLEALVWCWCLPEGCAELPGLSTGTGRVPGQPLVQSSQDGAGSTLKGCRTRTGGHKDEHPLLLPIYLMQRSTGGIPGLVLVRPAGGTGMEKVPRHPGALLPTPTGCRSGQRAAGLPSRLVERDRRWRDTCGRVHVHGGARLRVLAGP